MATVVSSCFTKIYNQFTFPYIAAPKTGIYEQRKSGAIHV
jgi:hypothetical protein